MYVHIYVIANNVTTKKKIGKADKQTHTNNKT